MTTKNMAAEPFDWTAWILGALGAMAAAVATLGRFIAGLYATRITQLESQVNKNEESITAMEAKHADCLEKHHQAELRIATLERESK